MKTAVEHFLDAIKDQIPLSNEHLEMIESYASQAKEMEKEQIYKALCRGHSDCGVFTMTSECEQYYNETFKTN
jgi:hypothetical protein